ncbi:MAG: hypothetical protein DRP96_02785 [Candidatus Neomarinimicrobiota bacterium]|nr:MAG: hypothetical protein DRP96_02785 [Candidatus Neomarinimicrobiota bacterium]
MSGKREQIIDAAYQLLAVQNYQNMTTSKIAQAAGVAEGTLYRYFKSKRHLLLEIIVKYSEYIMTKIFTNVSKDKPIFENLEHFADEFYKSLIADRTFYRMLFKLFSELDEEELNAAIRDYHTTYLNRIKGVFLWAKENAEINLSEREINNAVQSLWGMAEGFMKRTVLKINLPISIDEIYFAVNLLKPLLQVE